MALIDKLSAIGDAIRAKTGNSELLKLDDMPVAIASIETGGGGSDDSTLLALLNGSITEFRAPDGLNTITSYTFYNKYKLAKVDLNDVDGLQQYAFYGCSDLNELDLKKVKYFYGGNVFQGSSITSLDVSNVNQMNSSALASMKKLETVTGWHFPTVDSRCFEEDTMLSSIDLSDVTHIKTYAFRNTSSLSDIILPNIVEIQNNAFACYASSPNRVAKKIDIGANCKTIQGYAFENWTGVDTLIVRATTPPTLSNVNAFNFIPTATGDHGKYIYVPRDSLQAYWNATNWSAFVGSGLTYRAIEDYPEITGG